MNKYINYEVAMSYLGNMDTIFKKVGSSFLDNYKNFKEEVLTSLDNEYSNFNDYMNSKLYSSIHTLKGITLNLGMELLYNETLPILDSLKENIVLKEKIASMLHTFDASYNELKEMLI